MALSQPIAAVKPPADAPWQAALNAEDRAGEMRLNLIRLVAIVCFYGNHLVNYYLLHVDLDAKYHLTVSAIAAAWAAAAMSIHLVLIRGNNRNYLKYLALAWDVFMATSLVVFSSGPQSPFLVLLFLIIGSAGLRLDLRLVWAASLGTAVSYGIACGHSRWIRPETQVSPDHHIVFLLALGTAGLLCGQVVRQSLRLARNFADRSLAIQFAQASVSTEKDRPAEDRPAEDSPAEDSPNQEADS